jgi:hypothetical protein
VNPKSLRGGVRLVLHQALLISFVWSKHLHPEVSTVQVSLFNEVQVSPTLISEGEKVASRLLALAVTVNERASCTESVFPTHLHLRLISHPIHPEGIALGVTHLAEDGQADILCDRVARLQDESQVDLAILPGMVMAHELLGTSSHSPAGIMRASWHREDLLHAVKGALPFTDDESDRRRAKLYQAHLDCQRSRMVLASQKCRR